ncbi:MAG: DUF1343 domain-containing protein, partial [Bacteroidetes bacterium]|nr:DUF1343 domain-containing protein [Bacteroidota bacterium]
TGFIHISHLLAASRECRLTTVFGPQHGIFGQTQDNMIEWEGYFDEKLHIPVYSLYGISRKPTREMLAGIDALIVDLQDAGARLYTYIWTVKLCMEACSEAGIPVWILDRPNPIGLLGFDGPVLKEEFFTFVGGAPLPLCHRMTMAEMALLVRALYLPGCDLNVIPMLNWHRSSLYNSTGLPWVLPSPNLPTLYSTMVYPGSVLIEGLNLSEGRGTTTPFELFGAPWMNASKVARELKSRNLPGCTFREHDYIPVFHKYHGRLCHGIQIHVTDPELYKPVETALNIFEAIIKLSEPGALQFNNPPYEYEEHLMPFDILSGDEKMRLALINGSSLKAETDRWKSETEEFYRIFREVSLYPE